MTGRRKKSFVGSEDPRLCCTQLSQWVTCRVSPADSSCRKNRYQPIRHAAAAGGRAPGHVWGQYIQLQHTPADPEEEASLAPLSRAGLGPEGRSVGAAERLVCCGTAVQEMRLFAALDSTCQAKKMEELQTSARKKKGIMTSRGIRFPNEMHCL